MRFRAVLISATTAAMVVGPAFMHGALSSVAGDTVRSCEL